MRIKVIVPKMGDMSKYIGKPVNNIVDDEIGSVVEVKDSFDNTYELTLQVTGLYTKPNSDEYAITLNRGYL